MMIPTQRRLRARAVTPSSSGRRTAEADARALMKTVVGKYRSQLGGRKPTFKMATVNDKTVYRVRVGGVSKESANAICGKVKASGGSCFVAGN